MFTTLLNDTFHSRLPTGIEVLDANLDGGLPSQQLIQIAGTSGTGKTQLCLHLAAQVLISGIESGLYVIWIQTEGAFPVERLEEILTQKLAAASKLGELPALLNRILVDRVSERSDLLYTVGEKIGPLVQRYGKAIRLIVVDSLANVFRVPGDDDVKLPYVQRSREFLTLVSKLRAFCLLETCFLLLVNQATFRASGDVPALGKVWNSLVDVRIWLDKPRRPELSGRAPAHTLHLNSCPDSPPTTVHFRITRDGIASIAHKGDGWTPSSN